MKKYLLTLSVLFLFVIIFFQAVPNNSEAFASSKALISNPLVLPNAWINEFHYDNIGGDVGEFVEVVIQNPGSYTLSDFLVTLYNGATGLAYGTHNLGTTFTAGVNDPTDATFTYYYNNISGIQNGDPDGICLSWQGNVILFISYGGSFTATDGVANDQASTDVGSEVEASTPIGYSLGLTGSGTSYSDFTWTTFSDDTPGNPNGNQFLPVELSSFTASSKGNRVNLKWTTKTEVNNYGFEIERASFLTPPIQGWERIGFVAGAGNSNSPKDYSFSDSKTLGYGQYRYRLKQLDSDGKYEYSKEVEVDFGSVKDFSLHQNYPNPFNPSTFISYSIPQAVHVKLSVFNVLGSEIAILVDEFQEAGFYSKEFSIAQNGLNLTNGVYFYKLEAGTFAATKKFILMK